MRKILYVSVFLLFFLKSFSQFSSIGGDVTMNKQIVRFPTTAESYSISKVDKLPMDYFRGKANISIPIYNINLGNISIPISITYNSGGVKLNEVSSIVGLGWSLNIPGNIQQNIIGLNDLNSQMFSKNINDYNDFYGEIHFNTSNYEQLRQKLTAIGDNLYDTKPDLFDYNLPDASGSFVLKNNSFGLTIPNDDSKIIRNGNKFFITSNNGVKYWLSGRNTINTEYIGGSDVNVTYFNLDSLKTINNKISFEYGKYNTYTERNFQEKANFKLTPNIGGDYQLLEPLLPYEKNITTTTNFDNLITKIKYDEGEIYFKYSNDEGLAFSDGLNYRKDINGTSAVALRRIYVINKIGKIVRDITFNYSYFESSNSQKNYEDYRLKLIGIHNNLDNSNYKFTYNEEFNLPKRNSNNDDYWGYINSLNYNENSSNIPEKIKTEEIISDLELQKVNRRDREPNLKYAQLGSLKTIEYPTGGKKHLYYELPIISEKKSKIITDGIALDSINFSNSDLSLNSFSQIKNFTLSNDVFNSAINDGGFNLKLKWEFNNICDNATESSDDAQIFPSNCIGTINVANHVFTSNGRVFTGEIDAYPGMDAVLSLNRDQPCGCGISVALKYKKIMYYDSPITYSGLRINKIEDVNENNVTNTFEYLYGYYDQNNSFVNVANLKQPYNFSSQTKRYLRLIVNGDEATQSEPYFEKYLTLHNASQSNNSYGSTDIATYPYVIEKTAKGKVIMQFEDINSSNSSEINYQINYNKWKFGKLKKQIFLDNKNDTLKISNHFYKLNYLKNSLSDYSIGNAIENIAFACDFDILKSKMQLTSSIDDSDVDIFFVDHRIIPIESAKEEKVNEQTIEFLNGKKVITNTNYNYYDTNLVQPINLKNVQTIFPDNSVQEATYQYAFEKNNQKLLDANMVGIPLETITLKNGKPLSKVETLYPDQNNFPTSQAGNLLLPLSVKSTITNTISLASPPSGESKITEVTFDRYDSKGNILQYTLKTGVPVAIIWGYNQTQPIAKIEGATYAQAEAYSADIVAKSNLDIDAASEQTFITALDTIRNNTNLSNYQITTYSYDPLIGVTSITPPSGICEIYKYDTANRLQSVIDVNGNILKEYQYNYKQ